MCAVLCFLLMHKRRAMSLGQQKSSYFHFHFNTHIVFFSLHLRGILQGTALQGFTFLN